MVCVAFVVVCSVPVVVRGVCSDGVLMCGDAFVVLCDVGVRAVLLWLVGAVVLLSYCALGWCGCVHVALCCWCLGCALGCI